MTQTTENKKQIFGSVSHGTLRPEDLLVTFWETAERLEIEIPVPMKMRLEFLVGENSKESNWDDEQASDLLIDLMDLLGASAPNGFYFGSSYGDGSDFGFWMYEDWADCFDRGIEDCEIEEGAEFIRKVEEMKFSFDDVYILVDNCDTALSTEEVIHFLRFMQDNGAVDIARDVNFYCFRRVVGVQKEKEEFARSWAEERHGDKIFQEWPFAGNMNWAEAFSDLEQDYIYSLAISRNRLFRNEYTCTGFMTDTGSILLICGIS